MGMPLLKLRALKLVGGAERNSSSSCERLVNIRPSSVTPISEAPVNIDSSSASLSSGKDGERNMEALDAEEAENGVVRTSHQPLLRLGVGRLAWELRRFDPLIGVEEPCDTSSSNAVQMDNEFFVRCAPECAGVASSADADVVQPRTVDLLSTAKSGSGGTGGVRSCCTMLLVYLEYTLEAGRDLPCEFKSSGDAVKADSKSSFAGVMIMVGVDTSCPYLNDDSLLNGKELYGTVDCGLCV